MIHLTAVCAFHKGAQWRSATWPRKDLQMLQPGTWSLLLVWFLYAASIGFGQAADQARLRHDAMAEYSIGHFGKAETLLTPALESARQRGDSDEIASILKALGFGAWQE